MRVQDQNLLPIPHGGVAGAEGAPSVGCATATPSRICFVRKAPAERTGVGHLPLHLLDALGDRVLHVAREALPERVKGIFRPPFGEVLPRSNVTSDHAVRRSLGRNAVRNLLAVLLLHADSRVALPTSVLEPFGHTVRRGKHAALRGPVLEADGGAAPYITTQRPSEARTVLCRVKLRIAKLCRCKVFKHFRGSAVMHHLNGHVRSPILPLRLFGRGGKHPLQRTVVRLRLEHTLADTIRHSEDARHDRIVGLPIGLAEPASDLTGRSFPEGIKELLVKPPVFFGRRLDKVERLVLEVLGLVPVQGDMFARDAWTTGTHRAGDGNPAGHRCRDDRLCLAHDHVPLRIGEPTVRVLCPCGVNPVIGIASGADHDGCDSSRRDRDDRGATVTDTVTGLAR